jgi:VIT1/CCC1 family predicted Fe2+/Mn2+ transporter
MTVSDGFRARFDTHLRDEHRITRWSTNLREIVYGGNDGIVTTFAVVAGFAGAASGENAAAIGAVAVLVFGLANLFADATAMGLGSFLSSRSEQDVYGAVRAKELHEVRHNPDFERREIIQIFGEKGVTRADAETLADTYMRYPDLAADFMMQHEMGMPDPDGDNPAMNGLMTFLAFIAFGVIPLIPYLLMEPTAHDTFLVSVGATAGALVLLGLVRWRVTQESLMRCVGETVLVGGVCAAVAYAVGLAFRL